VAGARGASFWTSLRKFDFFAVSKSGWYSGEAALKIFYPYHVVLDNNKSKRSTTDLQAWVKNIINCSTAI